MVEYQSLLEGTKALHHLLDVCRASRCVRNVSNHEQSVPEHRHLLKHKCRKLTEETKTFPYNITRLFKNPTSQHETNDGINEG